MIVQVTGASTRNKGAELMLMAVRDHFGVPNSNVTLVVTPWFGSLNDRLKYNLAQKLEWSRWGRSRLAMSLTTQAFRHQMGIFQDEDVDAIIDISGFAFGDQHPPKRTIDFADKAETWKRQGKKVVLLPQALGPFETAESRDAFARIIKACDLVYARDLQSQQYVNDAFGSPANVRLAPDITIAKKAYTSHSEATDKTQSVLFVPNMRMLDKSERDEADRYIPLLRTTIRAAQSQGYRTAIVIHDSNEDRKLVPKIQEGLETEVETLEEKDPLALKQILAGAKLVVASRFHALVGALSSCVPVLATGWSHKYEMLLQDFDCSESILQLGASDSELSQQMEVHLQDSYQESCRQRLAKALSEFESLNQDMWSEVDQVLGWQQ